MTHSFVNRTMWDIVVTDQFNASWELKACASNMDEGYFEIRIQYDLRDPRVSLLNINLESGDKGSTLATIVENFKSKHSNSNMYITSSSIVLSYKVYSKDLQQTPSVFVKECGMVITLRSAIHDRLPINPKSNLGMELVECIVDHEKGFVFKVDIVDPHNKLGPMYINIGDVVNQVRVIRNPNYEEEGIYVSRSVEPTLDNPTGYARTRFELSEYDKVPLYASPALAMSHGNVVNRLKEEHEIKMQGLKFQHEDIKLKAEEIKLKHVEKIQRLESEVRVEQNNQIRLKAELDDIKLRKEKDVTMVKHELDVIKHDMEMRSLTRKDSSELFKWIPILIGSIGAILVAIKK